MSLIIAAHVHRTPICSRTFRGNFILFGLIDAWKKTTCVYGNSCIVPSCITKRCHILQTFQVCARHSEQILKVTFLKQELIVPPVLLL